MEGSIVFIIKFVLPAIATLVICLTLGQGMANESESILLSVLQGIIAGMIFASFAARMYAPDVDNPGRLPIFVALAVFCAMMAPTAVSALAHFAPKYHIACDTQPAGAKHKYC